MDSLSFRLLLEALKALEAARPSIARLATEEARYMNGPGGKIAPRTTQRDLLRQLDSAISKLRA